MEYYQKNSGMAAKKYEGKNGGGIKNQKLNFRFCSDREV